MFLIIIQHDFLLTCQVRLHTYNHQHTPPSPHSWHLRPFYSLSQLHPSPGYNHQSTRGRSERTQGRAKMDAWNSFSYIWTRALYSFTHCRVASTVIPLLLKATLTPSVRANLGLPLNFRHHQPSGHTVLVHCFHMPKPSQCSLICSTDLFQLV